MKSWIACEIWKIGRIKYDIALKNKVRWPRNFYLNVTKFVFFTVHICLKPPYQGLQLTQRKASMTLSKIFWLQMLKKPLEDAQSPVQIETWIEKIIKSLEKNNCQRHFQFWCYKRCLKMAIQQAACIFHRTGDSKWADRGVNERKGYQDVRRKSGTDVFQARSSWAKIRLLERL